MDVSKSWAVEQPCLLADQTWKGSQAAFLRSAAVQFVTRRSTFAIKEISRQLSTINSNHIKRFPEIVGVAVDYPYFVTLKE